MRCLITILCLICSSLSAQDATTKLIKLGTIPDSKILEDEGTAVRVSGFVEATRSNATGIHFLDFKDSDFVCVTFGRYVGDFPEGPPSEIYKEKWLEVSGTIQNYRGAPQIRLESPDQVKILETPPPAPAPEKPAPAEAEPEPETVTETKSPPVEPEKTEPKRYEPEMVDGVPALDWRKYFPE
ncbi:MAG: hypothetical protein P1U89_02760 [Verrucomicrobiales bacterium]|nr:hypothetical protein [Verrucomicrobiales bacterium]